MRSFAIKEPGSRTLCHPEFQDDNYFPQTQHWCLFDAAHDNEISKINANLLWKVFLQLDDFYKSHDDNDSDVDDTNDNDNNNDNDNDNVKDNINDDNNLLWQVSLQPDGTYKTESRLSFIATRWTFGL